jgi:hypothetical protein
MFQQTPVHYVHRIVTFCGLTVTERDLANLPYKTQENKAISSAAIVLRRWLNYFFVPDLEHNPIVLSPFTLKTQQAQKLLKYIHAYTPHPLTTYVEKRFKATIVEHVGDYYSASNRKTTALINIDLSQYGYDL